MDELMQKYFERNPVSRQLYYMQKLDELDRADKMVTFLTYAAKKGTALDLAIGVDFLALPISINLDTYAGRSLQEYLLQWVAGVRNYIHGEIDELLLAWPALVDFRTRDKDGAAET
jgi:hypothetical protein